ncbi:MAG TPA: signal peptidase II [Actinomycetota bacterium]|nr:signal peptidase II [Actinomycetota bacterium]
MPASESHAPAADGPSGGPVPADQAAASSTPHHDAATRHRLMFVLYGTALGVYLLDRLTKTLVAHNFHEPTTLIPGILQLKYTENSGGAFGVFDGAVWLFLLATIVVVGVIIYASFNLPNRVIAVALGLVLAGAIGNLTDRAVRGTTFFGGHVVDFLAFAKSPTAQPVWPVFNLADSAIVCGALLILFASIRKTTHHS